MAEPRPHGHAWILDRLAQKVETATSVRQVMLLARLYVWFACGTIDDLPCESSDDDPVPEWYLAEFRRKMRGALRRRSAIEEARLAVSFQTAFGEPHGPLVSEWQPARQETYTVSGRDWLEEVVAARHLKDAAAALDAACAKG